MSDNYKDTVKEIHEMTSQYNEDDMGYDGVFIGDEASDSIFIYDYTDTFEYAYRIYDIDTIDKDWLKKRTIITPSAEKTGHVNIDHIIDWMFNKIPKETFRTLTRLVFIYDDVNDYDYLRDIRIDDYIHDFYELLESHELPDEHQLGLSWATAFCSIINIKAITDTVDEMLKKGEIFDYEYATEIDIGIKMTIAHELRHLQQNDQFVSDEIAKDFLADDEEDAEEFARTCYERIENLNHT